MEAKIISQGGNVTADHPVSDLSVSEVTPGKLMENSQINSPFHDSGNVNTLQSRTQNVSKYEKSHQVTNRIQPTNLIVNANPESDLYKTFKIGSNQLVNPGGIEIRVAKPLVLDDAIASTMSRKG